MRKLYIQRQRGTFRKILDLDLGQTFSFQIVERDDKHRHIVTTTKKIKCVDAKQEVKEL